MNIENAVDQPDNPKQQARKSEEALGVSLAPEEIAELEEQLQGCPPCLEFIESLKTTVKMCKEIGTNQQPSPLDPAVRQQMLEAYQAIRSKKKTASSAPAAG